MWDKIIIFLRQIPPRLLLLAQSLPYVSLAIDLNSHRRKAGEQPKNAGEGENLPRGFARNLDQHPAKVYRLN